MHRRPKILDVESDVIKTCQRGQCKEKLIPYAQLVAPLGLMDAIHVHVGVLGRLVHAQKNVSI